MKSSRGSISPIFLIIGIVFWLAVGGFLARKVLFKPKPAEEASVVLGETPLETPTPKTDRTKEKISTIPTPQTPERKEETSEPRPETPGEVAVAFFDYCNQKKYSEAEKLLTPESLESVNSKGGLEKTWGTSDAQHLEGIEVSKEEISGDTSKVWLTAYVYGEKGEFSEPMELIKIEGKWKLSRP